MTRGISKRQRTILALLRGDERGRVYANCAGLHTSELLEELTARGLVNENAPRKQQMATVFRSCRALLERDLVSGEWTRGDPYHWAQTVCWRATSKRGD